MHLYKWFGPIWILIALSGMALGQQIVYYFKIDAEIDPRTSRKVTKALESAVKTKAEVTLLELNTFGGTVDDADKIRTALLNHPTPMYVFINKNAASAGALIAIACDSIYMAPAANIGAATVVNNTGTVVPEKYQSYMRSMMRSTAETNNRDATIAEAMVDPDVDLDSTIKKNGKVLTFTTSEALKNKFCEAQVANISEILERNHLQNATLVSYEESTAEKIISFFLNPVVSSVLILIIISGIYFELQTPGVGFPLIAAIIAALLYFTPYYLNGLAQNWEIILFIAGVLLLAAEFFIIPGFGVAGISGIIFMITALILSMLNNDFFDFGMVNSSSLQSAIYISIISFALSVVLVIICTKQLIKSKKFKEISLYDNKIDANAVNSSHIMSLIGAVGICSTDLKPSGKVTINHQQYDAFTSGELIEKGTQVVVYEIFNNTLKVRIQA